MLNENAISISICLFHTGNVFLPGTGTGNLKVCPLAGADVAGFDVAGALVGADAGALAGLEVGALAGVDAGALVGADAGALAGLEVGALAGVDAGALVGADAGAPAGAEIGALTGAEPACAFATGALIAGGDVREEGAPAATGADAGAELAPLPAPLMDLLRWSHAIWSSVRVMGRPLSISGGWRDCCRPFVRRRRADASCPDGKSDTVVPSPRSRRCDNDSAGSDGIGRTCRLDPPDAALSRNGGSRSRAHNWQQSQGPGADKPLRTPPPDRKTGRCRSCSPAGPFPRSAAIPAWYRRRTG